MIKVLFVCLGNICRSPAAEGVFKKMVKDLGQSENFIVDSAGTGGWHVGELPDERMRNHSAKRGVVLDSRARQFDGQNDFQKFDYIIGMDDSNIENILSFNVSKELESKVYKMTDFRQNLGFTKVPDPYYGGEDGFEEVLDILDDSLKGFLKHIQNK